MEARDYKKLVEALRSHLLSAPLSLLSDAADAISELQDTVQAQDKALKECAEQLSKSTPKRGWWIKESHNNQHNLYRCSVCGLEMLTNPDYAKKHKFCFGCGAKMEVQDGR